MVYSVHPRRGPDSDSKRRIEEGATTSITLRIAYVVRSFLGLRGRQKRSTGHSIYSGLGYMRRHTMGKTMVLRSERVNR